MSLDLTKYEEFSIELVKRIKTTTATYRRKWNKVQANLPPEPEPNPIGDAYVEFVNEAEICADARKPLQALIEAITGKELVIPSTDDAETPTFPDLPIFAAIAYINDNETTYIAVYLDTTGRMLHELNLGDALTKLSSIESYQLPAEVRVATITEITRWAKHFLAPEYIEDEDHKALIVLYQTWLAFCQ